jgi:hypothetical protein
MPQPQLPEPIAPQGIVPWQLPSEADEEEPAPGTSVIDDLDKRMARLSAMTGPEQQVEPPVDELPEATGGDPAKTPGDELAEGGVS